MRFCSIRPRPRGRGTSKLGGIEVSRGAMFGPSQPNSLGLPCDSLLYRWVQNDSLFIAGLIHVTGLRVIHFLPLDFRAIHFFFIAGLYVIHRCHWASCDSLCISGVAMIR